MHNRSWMYLSSVIVSLALGCGSKHKAPSSPPAEAAQQPRTCPMLKGAQITASDDDRGVTITFTTSGDPTELRAHVRQMAAMHDRMSHGEMGGGEMGGGEMGGAATGSGEMGSGEVGSGEMGSGEMGSGATGSGATGSGEMGGGETGSAATGGGEMGSGKMGSGGMHGHMAMVPSHAVVEDIDHGARMRITPDDPAQLATLREQVHAHVAMMTSGRCPMLETEGPPPPAGAPPAHDTHEGT